MMNYPGRPDDSCTGSSSHVGGTPVSSSGPSKGLNATLHSIAKAAMSSDKQNWTEFVQQVKTFSWADWTDEKIEISEEQKRALEAETLVSLIKSKGLSSGKGFVIIPGNLATEAPLLAQKLEYCAKIAGYKTVKDASKNVDIPFKGLFSLNEAERETAAEALTKVNPQTQKALLNLAKMSDLLEKIPTGVELESTDGRQIMVFIVYTMLGAFAEVEYDTSSSHSAKWWKPTVNVRKSALDAIEPALGGGPGAEVLLCAVEIIYRAFVRETLKNKRSLQVTKELELELKAMLVRTVCSGPALATRCHRIITEVVSEKTPDPIKKGKFVTTSKRVKKYARPKIPEGPMAPWESAVIAKVNSSIVKVEACAPNLRKFQNPCEWEEKIATAIEEIGASISSMGKAILARKRYVRDAILAARTEAKLDLPHVEKGESKNPISTTEWNKAQAGVLKEQSDKFEKEFLEGMTSIMGESLTKDQLSSLTESSIVAALSRFFTSV
jgi:hypothetical protein